MDFDDIKATDEAFIMHTYNRHPVAFVRGNNARLFDTQGRDYIDFGAGIGVCSIGHGNAKLAHTIADQAGRLIHTSNLYYIEPQAKLAKDIIRIYRENSTFSQDMRVFFANSGAEANEGAIKLARLYGEKRGRYNIITISSSFHGRTLATLKATAQPQMHTHFAPFPDGFIYADSIKDVENKIDKSTVAVMIELVQGEGGIAPMDKQDIQCLESTLKKHDILLIIDEVQSGIFRTGEIFASKVYGINPQIITTAKGLAGGVPIGAIISTLIDTFSYGEHGSTFGGNFLSSSAAITTLEILESLQKSGALQNSIDYFHIQLEKIVNDFSMIFSSKVGLGLMCGLVMKNAKNLPTIITKCLQNGLIVLKSGKGVVRFLPPLSITKDEIDDGFMRLRNTLAHF